MTLSSNLIIIIVIVFAFYLVYSQRNQQQKLINTSCPSCNHNNKYSSGNINTHHSGNNLQSLNTNNHQIYPQNDNLYSDNYSSLTREQMSNLNSGSEKRHYKQTPQITNIVVDNDNDPFSDPIKKQDLYTMYDPLTYPQLRLPRDVLEKYNEFYDKNGVYPPFNQSTQSLFDNPVLNGVLIKQVDENEPFQDNVPSSVPLFRVKSAKNSNRYFYYIIDQRYLSKIEPKIPLDHIKVNNIRYSNADFYGIPELFDGDIIENIPIYPGSKFKVTLYKTFHFP